MRNVLMIPFQGEGTLIVASDNSGGIGKKRNDYVFVPYETAAYYSFRVAVMECLAAGGEPAAVILSNFCGNEAWSELTNGIKRGLCELDMKDIMITGSTESNFSMQQSAFGIIVLGRKPISDRNEIIFNEQLKIAVIGKPLVGNEVMEYEDQIAPLSIFQKISRLNGARIWPAGSKGILSELNQMFRNKKFLEEQVLTDIDILKSSGPAACFIALYETNREQEIKRLAGSHFHSIQIKK